MFLACLQDDDQKELFLDLARIIAICEGDVAFFEESIDWGLVTEQPLEKFYEAFLGSLTSETEQRKFDAVLSELRVPSRRSAHSMAYRMLHNEVRWNSSSTFDEDTRLVERLMGAFEAAIKAKGADPGLKKKVMEKLIEHGVELGAINEKLVKIKLSLMPEVREAAILNLVNEAFSQLQEKIEQEEVESLDLAQSKAIMLELTAMGDVSGSIDPIERKALELIQQTLGLDPEFLDEAVSIVEKINAASLEAFELITE